MVSQVREDSKVTLATLENLDVWDLMDQRETKVNEASQACQETPARRDLREMMEIKASRETVASQVSSYFTGAFFLKANHYFIF